MITRRTLLAAPLLALAGCSKPNSRVVVYSAQDREFAEDLFADFTRATDLWDETRREMRDIFGA